MSGNTLPGGEPQGENDRPASPELVEATEQTIPAKLAEAGFDMTDEHGTLRSAFRLDGEFDRLHLINYPAGLRGGDRSRALLSRSDAGDWPHCGGVVYVFIESDDGSTKGWRYVKPPFRDYHFYRTAEEARYVETLEGQTLQDFVLRVALENQEADEEAQRASGQAVLTTQRAIDLIVDIAKAERIE